MGVRNQLARIGIDVLPYYWVKEGYLLEPPKIKGKADNYEFCRLYKEDLELLKGKILNYNDSSHIGSLERGNFCFALKNDGEVAAYMFAQFEDEVFSEKRFVIKKDEAYLTSMYTFESHRGKGLAPYLRYRVYEHLKGEGYKSFYSISSYLNKPTLKFKKKLKAQNVQLILSLGLANRFVWNFTIWRLKDDIIERPQMVS